MPDLFRLDDRVAIVTGASSGLGVAFAQALAEAGADVVLGARRVDRLEETADLVRAAGRRVLVVADRRRRRPDDCQALVDAAMAELGRVDVLVNNAGVGTAVPATHETPEQFRRVIDVNLNGCYWMAQACGRVMQPGSSIVNISSVLSLTTAGLPQAAYAASKAGLNGLTRDLAQQWTGRKGIRVNSVAPGFFASEMTDQYPPGYLEAQQARIPAGRKGDPAELAATVVFLASPASGYITGQIAARRRRDDDHLTGRGRPAGGWRSSHQRPADRQHQRHEAVADAVRRPHGLVGEQLAVEDREGADHEHPDQLDGDGRHGNPVGRGRTCAAARGSRPGRPRRPASDSA